MKNDTEPQAFRLDALPWTIAEIIDRRAADIAWNVRPASPFYLARHQASRGLDVAAMERFHVDSERAHRAMKVLSGLAGAKAKQLYRELHAAGVLYPTRVGSIPVATFTADRAA